MAVTVNIDLIPDQWVKGVDAGVAFLANTNSNVAVQVAVTAGSAPAAGVIGHNMRPGEAITRAVIGDGAVWFKQEFGQFVARLVVSK